jgi:hypothetical protein
LSGIDYDEPGSVSTRNVTSAFGGSDIWGTTGLASEKIKKPGAKGPSASGAGRKGRAARPADSHVANALRSAYEETVKEDVPSEFLDLLGKLS